MLRSILWATLTVATVFAAEFTVLYSPDNVVFTGEEPINQSLLRDVFTSVLGFTITPSRPWSGLLIEPPFNLPEAVVVIVVEGIQELDSQIGKVFKLNDDEIEEITWQGVSGTVEDRSKDNKLVRIRMAGGLDAFGESALGTLKPTPIDEGSLSALSLKNDEDRKILEEIKLLDAIAKNVPSDVSANGKSDVYWLVVSGMQPLIESYGKDSAAVKEALIVLNQAISNVTEAFRKGYKNKTVIAAFTNDVSKVRNTRAAELSRQRREDAKVDDNDKNIKATENTSSTPVIDSIKMEDFNLGKKYSEYYPAIFNIFLWFGVIFFFSLLAICITIADMDPGRDSIIYRMTSTRMKKDN
ncbi:ATPase H(+)-transporting accessory protein 2 isoform X2 [Venturia canescens]|uniref:ATPase H(+)-transporting accessory protein 2 isoform X2 n=1 Tax=Venturia canescens TaxID=32260 RepID=UPI001C9CD5D9|nr:ATPase H(+)-transporting accessory protein 2 isoform X2 [Venturia canescens]